MVDQIPSVSSVDSYKIMDHTCLRCAAAACFCDMPSGIGHSSLSEFNRPYLPCKVAMIMKNFLACPHTACLDFPCQWATDSGIKSSLNYSRSWQMSNTIAVLSSPIEKQQKYCVVSAGRITMGSHPIGQAPLDAFICPQRNEPDCICPGA